MGGFCLGDFVQGDFVPGDFVLGGILSRGILSGGFCPGDFVLEPVILTFSWDRVKHLISFTFHRFVLRSGFGSTFWSSACS